MNRQLDTTSINQLKVWEGLPGSNGKPALDAYLDSAGVPTIGYGHTFGVKMGLTITQQEADDYLIADLAPACAAVEKYVNAPLGDHQFAALVSLCFNIGAAGFAASSVVKVLNQTPPNYAAVPAAIALWNEITDPRTGKKVIAQGLVNRRAMETTLWLLPDEAIKTPPPGGIAPNTPTLTTSDLRQVVSTSVTPEAPPTSAAQTKTGKASIVSFLTGSSGVVIEGAQHAAQIQGSLSGALSGRITGSQAFVLFSTLLTVASVATALYIYWRKTKEVNGTAK